MSVRIEKKKRYEMPPRDGFTVTHFITVADIDRQTWGQVNVGTDGTFPNFSTHRSCQ